MSTVSGAPSLRREGRTAIVTLQRPSVANRLQPEDVSRLYSYWQQIGQDSDIRSVVLTSTGKHFSSGYDLTSMHSQDASSNGTSENAFANMVDALARLPQVTICALNGGVYGGATDLALACDFRFAVPTCKMFVPAAKLGLQYYLSGLRRYASRLGIENAKRLLLLAEQFDADQMLAIGYLHKIVAPEELMPHAILMAQEIEKLAPLALAGMKEALNAIAESDIDAERVHQSEMRVRRSEDLKEGIAAWRDKRAPSFKGN